MSEKQLLSIVEQEENQQDNVSILHMRNDVSRDEPVGLQRQIGLLGLVAFLVGGIIGGGIFASPRAVAAYSGSTGAILLTWVGSGCIAILGALVFCELALTFPNACANDYSYIYEAFGDFPAFAVIYLKVITRPAGMALLSIVAGDYIMTAVAGQGDSVYSKAIGAGIIGINMFINCFSTRLVERTQILFTGMKMIPVTMLIVTGLVRLAQGHTENFHDAFNGTKTSVSDIAFSMYGGLYAYGGWNTLNFATAESLNPTRDQPIAVGIAIPLVMFCYMMVNVSYLTVKTPLQISSSSAIAVKISNDLYDVMHWIIPVLVACSVFGTSNIQSFKTGRIIYEAANRKHLPPILGCVHIKRHTPIPAIIFVTILAWLVLIPEATNFKSLLKFVQFLDWVGLSVAVAAMLWLRKSKPTLERPLKLFIGIPILFFVISLLLVVAPFVRYPVEQGLGACVMLPAVPLYLAFVKYQILPRKCIEKLDLLTKKAQYLGNLELPSQEKSEDMDGLNKHAEVH